MIAELLGSVSTVIQQFGSMLGSAFSHIGELFFTYSATDDSLTLTFLGTVAVISVGAGLVWLVYRLIKGAIRGIGR